MLISRNDYLKGFGITVVVLALVRCIFPSVAKEYRAESTGQDSLNNVSASKDTVPSATEKKTLGVSGVFDLTLPDTVSLSAAKHPLKGVKSYRNEFPDSNDLQIQSALLYGVEPVTNRQEAENRKSDWVYVAASPFYQVDSLRNSIPYLVPRAAVLLNDIGRNFFDSLQVKKIPLHKIIVTSVTRSQDDLERLKKINRNTSENSCHLYGTTFDVSYKRYATVADPDGPERRVVRSDTLKWVLSEVLRDLRQQQRCLVKYEVKQGCFHITVK